MKLPLRRFAPSPSLASREGDDAIAARRLLLKMVDMTPPKAMIDAELQQRWATIQMDRLQKAKEYYKTFASV